MKWFYDYDAFEGALHPQAWLTPVVEETMGVLWVYRADIFSPPGPRPFGFRDENDQKLTAPEMWVMICEHDNVNVEGKKKAMLGGREWRPRLTFGRFQSDLPKPEAIDRSKGEELLP